MLSSGSADTRGAVGVGGCSPGGVDIGWGPTHGVLVSRGVTQNSTNTYDLAIGIPRKVISRKGNNMTLRTKRTDYEKKGKKVEMRREAYVSRRTSSYTYVHTRVTQSGP